MEINVKPEPKNFDAQSKEEAKPEVEQQQQSDAPKAEEGQSKEEAKPEVEQQQQSDAPKAEEAQSKEEAKPEVEQQQQSDAPKAEEAQSKEEAKPEVEQQQQSDAPKAEEAQSKEEAKPEVEQQQQSDAPKAEEPQSNEEAKPEEEQKPAEVPASETEKPKEEAKPEAAQNGVVAKTEEAPNAEEECKDAAVSPKVVVIFGVTDVEGNAVLQAMKADQDFKLKAVTSNADNDLAKELTKEGIEVIVGDLDNKESVKKAVDGAFGVFAVTNYWKHMDLIKEAEELVNLVEACVDQKVHFLVFSAYQAKDVVDKGITYCQVKFSFFMENLVGMMKPEKTEDGHIILHVPADKVEVDTISVHESGEVIHQIFVHHEAYKNVEVTLSSDKKTMKEYAEILGKNLEKSFKHIEVSAEDLAEKGKKEVVALYHHIKDSKFVHDVSEKLNPKISDFENWVKEKKDELVKEIHKDE